MNDGVHRTHCCAGIHGCKYMDDDCPVQLKRIPPQYKCQDCEEERQGLAQRLVSMPPAEDPADTVARLALVQKLRACTEAEAQAMALILQHEAVIERLRWALAGVLELHDASRAPGQFSEPLAWARVRLALRA